MLPMTPEEARAAAQLHGTPQASAAEAAAGPASLPSDGSTPSQPFAGFGGQPSQPFPSLPAADEQADGVPTIGHIGRYALKRCLGQGGLGTVHAAYDPILSRSVAVKTLHLGSAGADRNSLDALILNEARAAAGLSHPHIVTVYDAGLSEQGVYIAMERLRGRDLRQLLDSGWYPDPIQAALIVRRVADALAYAHTKGVVHCDVKPANIFMVGRTNPKVLDFGIARFAQAQAVPGFEDVVAGSPYYLAPEQLDGGTVDRRSDVYALGVVLYELLTRRKPFTGKSLEAITQAVRSGDCKHADEVEPNVPRALADIAARAMALNPDDRYRSARHLSQALRKWIENDGEDDDAPVWRRWLPVAAVAALVAAAGSAWLALHEPEASAPVAVVAPATPARTSGATAAPPPSLLPGALAAPAPAANANATPATLPNPSPSAAPVAALPAAGTAGPAQAGALVVAAAGTGTAAAKDGAKDSAKDGSKAAAPSKPAASAPVAKDRRQREAKPAAGSTAATTPAAVAATGTVQLAVSPWGQVEVDGAPAGVTPPLTRLTLKEGEHVITIRNEDAPAFTAKVRVTADQPVTLRHRF
jgi:serine/threonine-protein kinase